MRTLDEILEQAFTDAASDTMWQADRHVEIFATAKAEIQALITKAREEGMALTESDRFNGLDKRQIDILVDYHEKSLTQLKEKANGRNGI